MSPRCPAYKEKTLAALPVGANKTQRYPIEFKVFTHAATNDVFPVPA